MRKILLASLLLTIGLAHAQNVNTGEDVIRAMHDRYQSKWYKTRHLHSEEHHL